MKHKPPPGVCWHAFRYPQNPVVFRTEYIDPTTGEARRRYAHRSTCTKCGARRYEQLGIYATARDDVLFGAEPDPELPRQ